MGDFTMNSNILLSLNKISKSFGGVKALQNINIDVRKGEVHSIVGENGAGKSTMMKIISGALKEDEGEIVFDGSKVNISSPLDAVKLGITMVYQEPSVFSELSVLENLFLGDERKLFGGTLSWGRMFKEGTEMLALVDLEESLLSLRMGDLSLGTQQLMLIARGLYHNSKLLILDEPTSILSRAESERLFEMIEEFKKRGISILYISHRIPEVISLSDSITVLRDGQITGSLDPESATESNIITAMSGREINVDVYRPREYKNNPDLIKVKGLTKYPYFSDIEFAVKPGEIVGMYGLIGSGRSEMARVVFGEMERDSGEIEYDGRTLGSYNTRFAVDQGIYYVPEDRGNQGIFALHSIKYNMTSSFFNLFSKATGFLQLKKETGLVQDQIAKYSIKTDDQNKKIVSLSGGGQQKVVLARWLMDKPKLLILDEPTRGIDVKTKTEIHELIVSLAEEGVAILLISSDMPEVIRLSDRMLTMHKGRIVGELHREQVTEEKILRMALGLELVEVLIPETI
jgi:ABC-type sugar transport system ATPase subunit